MRVVFICDGDYAMPTSVAIASLVASTPASTHLDIAVVTAGVDQAALEPLTQLGHENARVSFVDGTDLLAQRSVSLPDSAYRTATKAALLKFFLPDLLPDWDKALYLDGDLLIRRDLSPLYHTELGDRYAAVVRDLPQVLYRVPLIGDDRDYFNSGVMLLNLALLREESKPQELFALKESLSSDNLVDQNVFNKAFRGRVIQVSPEYNLCCMNLQRRWRREHTLEKINGLYRSDYKGFTDLLNRSAIIHFSSKEKPWKYHDVFFVKEWEYYYRKTIYGNIPLKRKSYWLQRRLQFVRRVLLWEN